MKKNEYEKIYKEIIKRVDIQKVLEDYGIHYKSYMSKNGREHLMCCPFPDHDDMTPSFSINDKTGIYQCFSLCGGGDFIKFIKKMEGLKNIEQTINLLKRQIGLSNSNEINFSRVKDIIEKIKNFKEKEEEQETERQFNAIKLPQTYPAEKYLHITSKRVSLKNIKKWKMRYCHNPENKYDKKYHGRLIIPIYFEGKLITFAARDMIGRSDKWNEVKERILNGKINGTITKEKELELRNEYEFKKVLYPFGSPTHYVFFNWDNAIKNKEVIIVEGIFDAIKLIEWGYNAIAALCCHLNDYRIGMIMNHFDKVYICFDNDGNKLNMKGESRNPGQEAAKKLQKQLSELEVYNITLPIGKDPDDCKKEEFEKCFKDSMKVKFKRLH